MSQPIPDDTAVQNDRHTLARWVQEQRHRDGGPGYPDLFERVKELLQKDRNANDLAKYADEYKELAREVRSLGTTTAPEANRVTSGNSAGQEQVTMPPMPPGPLASADIARLLKARLPNLSANCVDCFLRRYAKEHRDCLIPNENPHRGEPRNFYRTADVWPALERQLPKWQNLRPRRRSR
jgi:hypothetical protein